ncbi:BF3164 family lipoprotein [Pedobacter sp. Du54]|uniref:BF3164 family lipoprotein n=1 Tax=Pedobacter anseongensis TaxID=3133439 RepID=UPI0030B0951D
MKNMSKICNVTLLLATLFIGCDSKERTQIANVITFSGFKSETDIKFDDFLKFEKGIARNLILGNNSIVIVNSNAITDYVFYKYSLPSKTLDGRYIKGGRKFGQALGPMSNGVYNTIFWLHDVTKNKIITYRHTGDSALSVPKDSGNEYAFPTLYYSIQLLDSMKLLASGSFDSKSKLQVLDLVSGKKEGEFGSYLPNPKHIPFNSWKMAYQSFLFIKPKHDKAVLACRLTDRIEIFDLRSKKNIIIQGPENFKPEFTPMRSGNMDLITRNEKSRFAFVNGLTTDRYIYLLYSGNLHNSPNLDYGKYVYIYDWEGNPIKKLNLDRYVSCISIDRGNKTIYAFDVISKSIVKANLSFN